MKKRLKKALVYFLAAYITVTILAYGISYAAGAIYKLPSYQDLGVSLFQDPAFVMTVPYHLLVNLLVWVLFSWFYFKTNKPAPLLIREAVNLALLWLCTAMIVDLVFFVLIKSPVSLTPRQFYVEYQPWISLTYVILFASPVISFFLLKWKMRQR